MKDVTEVQAKLSHLYMKDVTEAQAKLSHLYFEGMSLKSRLNFLPCT